MRQTIGATLVSLAIVGTAAAQERLVPSNPVAFPEPSLEFERHSQVAAGPWRIWVDAKAIDPAMQVATYALRVYRTDVDVQPELLLETHSRRGDHDLRLSHSGQVLICSRGQFVLYPVGGDPLELTGLSDGNRRARPVSFEDDALLAVRGGRSRGTLELLLLDLAGEAPPVMLESASYPREPRNFVRDGHRVAWLRPSAERRGPPTVRVAAPDEPARDVPLTDAQAHLTLDGLFGDWLVAHQEDLVRLLEVETGRELQLRLPGRVVLAHPRGILWAGTVRAGSNAGHLVWWDLGTGKRRHLLAQTHGQRGTPEYRLTPDGLVVARRDGVSLIRLDVEPQSPDPGTLAAAAKRLGPLRQAWAEQPDQAWRASHDLRWPLGPEAPELLAEIAATSDDPNLARRAAALLGASGDPAVRPVVLGLLSQVDDLFVWTGVVEAVTRMGDAEDAEAILACDPVSGLVEEVADALGILGNADSAAWLESKRGLRFPMRSQAEDTQAAVERALRLLGDRSDALNVLDRLRD